MYSLLIGLFLLVGCNLQNVNQEEIIEEYDRDTCVTLLNGNRMLNQRCQESRSREYPGMGSTKTTFSETGMLNSDDTLKVEIRNSISSWPYKVDSIRYSIVLDISNGFGEGGTLEDTISIGQYNETGLAIELDGVNRMDSLFHSITKLASNTEPDNTYLLLPKQEMCSGVYYVHYKVNVSSFINNVQEGGGGFNNHYEYYFDGGNYCDSLDRKSLDYFDVEFTSGSFESMYDLDLETNYTFLEIVEGKSNVIDIIMTTIDSTILLSSVPFIKKYVGNEEVFLDASSKNILTIDSLVFTSTEFYTMADTALSPVQKGDLNKYFISNEFNPVFFVDPSDSNADYITIDSVGQQFYIKSSGQYMGKVLSIDRSKPGSEVVVFRFYY